MKTLTRRFTMAMVTATGSLSPLRAQTAPAKWADTVSTAVGRACVAGDLPGIQTARGLAERVAVAYPNDGLLLHYQGYALYCEADALIGEKRDGWSQLERAQSMLEQSLATHPLPETYALMASIDGQLIGKDPTRAMELSGASEKAMNQALALGPANPRVWMIRGMNTFFTPPEYGGGAKDAQAQLLKALGYFKTDAPKRGEPAWGVEEVHMWLGQTYDKLGDKTKAAAEYKTALDLAPNFGYAKALASALKP